ncbi:MAG: peptide chain release factor N(5)-glutamine methyltransferase [Chloroflexota bacterium]
MTTIQQAWQSGRSRLASSPSPELDARLLLEHVLQQPHSYLIAHSDEPLSATQSAEYEALLERAEGLEPIPYLIGTAPFFGLDFVVSPAVLSPRPETEMLVEHALRWAVLREAPVIVDVGTGSGCIAVTLAQQIPQAEVVAVDISADALAVAEHNAARHAPGRVQFMQGDLLGPIGSGVDLITANLPYITDGEWTSVADGVKLYEPEGALRGGPDGLDHFRRLIPAAAEKLNSGGMLLLEIGWRQGKAVRCLARESFPHAEIIIIPDFAGHERLVVVEALQV